MWSSSGFRKEALSQYTLNSAAWAYLSTHKVEGWLKKDDIPESTPIQMTTSGLNLFFSNLERDFGAYLDFEEKLSRSQTLRLVEMLLASAA